MIAMRGVVMTERAEKQGPRPPEGIDRLTARLFELAAQIQIKAPNLGGEPVSYESCLIVASNLMAARWSRPD